MKKALVLKSARQRTALERIDALFVQASLRRAYAKRYVALARRIASKYKVRVPERWRRRFCKGCSAFWVPGVNCTVRTRKSRIVMKCLECGALRRLPIKRQR